MFEYDSFYDILFGNEDFLNVLYKFHSSNWDKMDYKERKKVVEDEKIFTNSPYVYHAFGV